MLAAKIIDCTACEGTFFWIIFWAFLPLFDGENRQESGEKQKSATCQTQIWAAVSKWAAMWIRIYIHVSFRLKSSTQGLGA